MRRTMLFCMAVAVALAFFPGCKKVYNKVYKKVYLVPTPEGWSEMEISEDGDQIKVKPAEKVEVQYK